MLDVSGPVERTGKARGTDLLDGTVTLPLIVAAEADPSIREADLRALDAAAAERALRPHRRDRCPRPGALAGPGAGREAKAELDGDAFDPEQRQLLGLVADGVVQRYS